MGVYGRTPGPAIARASIRYKKRRVRMACLMRISGVFKTSEISMGNGAAFRGIVRDGDWRVV